MASPFKFEGEYSHAALVKRAVHAARPHGHGQSPRWVAVREVFGWGSTTSQHLCLEFGLDPNEMLDGCSDCAARERADRENLNGLSHNADQASYLADEANNYRR
jgi:hypothetical protein